MPRGAFFEIVECGASDRIQWNIVAFGAKRNPVWLRAFGC
jgi:hypothetical protein